MHRRKPRPEKRATGSQMQSMQSLAGTGRARSLPTGERGSQRRQRDGRRALRELTMEGLWELLTRHQPGLEEAEVVGAVLQVVGHGPVHSQRGKAQQGQLGGKPLQQLDRTELVSGL